MYIYMCIYIYINIYILDPSKMHKSVCSFGDVHIFIKQCIYKGGNKERIMVAYNFINS